jgi:hypothetical protein
MRMSRLLIFGSFAHDAQGVLATVYRLAAVCVELLLDGRLRVAHVGVSRELRVAPFADSEHRDVPNPFHDPKIALWHTESLAHSAGRA